jgi:hypothetical protein
MYKSITIITSINNSFHHDVFAASKIKHPLVKRFASKGYMEFFSFAKKTTDTELLTKIKIVQHFNNALPSHINKIRSKCIRDPELAGGLQ